MYDPAQLKPGFFSCCPYINWYSYDSPFCYTCALTNRYLLLSDHKSVDLENEDWMTDILETPFDEYSKKYNGIWWLRDHALHTTVFTMQDLKKENYENSIETATISMSKNWMRNETTCLGVMLSIWYKCAPRLKLYIDNNQIQLGDEHFGIKQLMIKVKNHSIANSGDFVRKNIDKNGNIIYTYLIQKIAYKTHNGDIIKTQAYNEFKKRITNTTNIKTSSLFTCKPSLPCTKINSRQMIRY